MDDFAEQLIEKRVSASNFAASFCSIVLIVLGIIALLFIGGNIGLTLIVIGAVLLVFAKSRQNVELEYEFANGDCEISKIFNKSTRKSHYKFNAGDVQRVLKYSLEKCSNELEVNSKLTVMDMTSGKADTKDNWYVFFVGSRENMVAAILELNEKTLNHVKIFYKNKLEV